MTQTILRYHTFSPGFGVSSFVFDRTAEQFAKDLSVVGSDAAICLDDGHISQFYVAVPEMDRRGIKGYFFISTDLVGTYDYMSWDHLRDIAERGHFIECHGNKHIDLTDIAPIAAASDISSAYDAITHEIGRAPEFFFPPYSRSHSGIEVTVRNLGMKMMPRGLEIHNDTDLTGISTNKYWDEIYGGKVKAEKGGHEQSRFSEVFKYLEGETVIDVGAGYAALCKEIAAKFPEKVVVAFDFSAEAAKRSGYHPYIVGSCYDLSQLCGDRTYDLLVCTQAMEYMVDNDRFLREAAKVAKKAILTVPRGKHSVCSQLREYSLDSFRALLAPHGIIEVLYEVDAMIIAKVRFSV